MNGATGNERRPARCFLACALVSSANSRATAYGVPEIFNQAAGPQFNWLLNLGERIVEAKVANIVALCKLKLGKLNSRILRKTLIPRATAIVL